MYRRTLILAAPILVFGCTTLPDQPAGPPSLAQVQAWASAVVPELPTLLNTLRGTVSPLAYASMQSAVAQAQALLPVLQALQLGAQNAATVVREIGDAVTLAASFIPAVAPFAPMVSVVVALIEGFLASQPVTVAGQPVPEKPPVASVVHAAAIARRR